MAIPHDYPRVRASTYYWRGDGGGEGEVGEIAAEKKQHQKMQAKEENGVEEEEEDEEELDEEEEEEEGEDTTRGINGMMYLNAGCALRIEHTLICWMGKCLDSSRI